MIIVRTSYPWTSFGVLFRQRFAVAELIDVDVEIVSLPNRCSGLIVRYYVNGELDSVKHYRYNALFSYIQAVKQVLLTDYYISVDWFGKFKVIDEDGNVVNF